jgi:hypothetical protein
MPGVARGVGRWRRHHEVWILIAAGDVGRSFGSQPHAKVSMMITRLRSTGIDAAARGFVRAQLRASRVDLSDFSTAEDGRTSSG